MSKTTVAGITAGAILLALVVGVLTHLIDGSTFATVATTVTAFGVAVVGWLSKDDQKH